MFYASQIKFTEKQMTQERQPSSKGYDKRNKHEPRKDHIHNRRHPYRTEASAET